MFIRVTLSLLSGFYVTFKLFFLTLLFSLPLGLIIAFAVKSRFKILSAFSQILILIMRGTPLMLQLIIIYYGPGIFIKHNIWGSGDGGRFMASLIAFVINYACYFAAIYRGGMESIPKGQYEAGYVMHMNKVQIFVYIIFLQMVKHILPAISNEVISLVKDTSLARVVAVYEIIWSGQSFIKSSGIIWPLLYTGIFYLAFNGLLTLLFKKAEEKLAYIQ